LHNLVHRAEGMAFFILVFCEAVGMVIVPEGCFVFSVSLYREHKTAVSSKTTLMFSVTTRRHTPLDTDIHIQRRDNDKSDVSVALLISHTRVLSMTCTIFIKFISIDKSYKCKYHSHPHAAVHVDGLNFSVTLA